MRSRPIRCTRIGIGTFPLRKPGIRADAARSDAACSTAWWTSPAGTSTVRRTRSPSSCSTCVCIGPLNQTRCGYRARAMDAETAIRTRRTHKQYGPEPVDRATLEDLLDLARFAPNHHLTQPWRFRVLGPMTLARLREAAGPKEAAKLERAPTLIVASAALTGDALQD